jgi:uncharacterized protein DUF3309
MGSTTDKASGSPIRPREKSRKQRVKPLALKSCKPEASLNRRRQGWKLAGDAKQAVKDATNKVVDAANKKLWIIPERSWIAVGGGRSIMPLGTILLIILILLVLGALPTWPYSGEWGYYPSGGLGLVFVVVLVLVLMGRL